MRTALTRCLPRRTLLPVSFRRRAYVAAIATAIVAPWARAQVVPGEGADIGTLGADRARLRQLIGLPADSLPLKPSSGWGTILPTLRIQSNSSLPGGGNDGALWAGRGWNASVSGGAWYARRVTGRGYLLRVRLEPELTYSQNRPFPLLPGRVPDRSTFSSPFHAGPQSADLPLRFGDQPLRTIGLGQSAITLTMSRVTFGASAANEWWGPAARNTLVQSNNAAGIPRLFAETTTPIRTRFGSIEGRAFIGGLIESPYFDRIAINDVRSANGLLVTWRPSLDTGLTLGLSRLVIAPVGSPLGVLPHVLDALVRYEPIQEWDAETGRYPQSIDQNVSLFARWVFPASGFETYVEWARVEVPRSLRDLLVAPQSTQGYTLGVQWTDPSRAGGHLRLHGEVTYLEQTALIAGRPLQDFYTGRAAAQGFTQRGQILGAAIGPGSSSQFIAADWIAPRWQAGIFAARIRHENDALYREYPARLTQHDVTVQGGLRGGVRLPTADFAAELTSGMRYNYLFQSDYYLGTPVQAVDVRNVTLAIILSPR